MIINMKLKQLNQNKQGLIMLNIEPIKLLSGAHSDTAQTGQGCFMNVIAYLNGESQITDQSLCVCVTIRPIAIFLNDFANDEQRQRLLPFVLRAMGTATNNKEVIQTRIKAVVEFAEFNARLASKFSQSVAQYTAKSEAESVTKFVKYAAESAQYAAEYAAKSNKYAAEYAAKSAESTAESVQYSAEYAAQSAVIRAKYQTVREEIFTAGLKFLEKTCNPPCEQNQVIIDRANKLIELAVA